MGQFGSASTNSTVGHRIHLRCVKMTSTSEINNLAYKILKVLEDPDFNYKLDAKDKVKSYANKILELSRNGKPN